MYRIYFIDNCNKIRSLQVDDLNNVNLGVANFILAIEYLGELVKCNTLNFSESAELERYFYGCKDLSSIAFLSNNVVLQPAIRHLMLSKNQPNVYSRLLKHETITRNIVVSHDIEYVRIQMESATVNFPEFIGNKSLCVQVKYYSQSSVVADLFPQLINQGDEEIFDISAYPESISENSQYNVQLTKNLRADLNVHTSNSLHIFFDGINQPGDDYYSVSDGSYPLSVDLNIYELTCI